MIQPLQRCRHEIDWTHHRRRQGGEDRFFEAGDRGNARVLAAARLQIDARAPHLAERVGGSPYHAGQRFQAVKLPKRDVRQDRLDGGAERFIVDRTRQTAREARGELLESHDVEAVVALTCGRESQLAHRQSPMRDNRAPFPCSHGLPPSQSPSHRRF